MQLEKLIVAQLAKTFSASYETNDQYYAHESQPLDPTVS
jgi:hypothetical protein